MALGEDLTAEMGDPILRKILNKIGGKSLKDLALDGYIVSGDGVPAGDAGSDPTKVGVIYWDYTNSDIYVCTAYTDADNHTWTLVWT